MTFLKPYIQLARLDKLTVVGLLLWPCWWGIIIAEPSILPLKEMLLFLAGAVLMRGAGCTYNDLVDRHYDAKVERTAHRPLAAKTVTVFQAIIFLGFQLISGLIVLLQFSQEVQLIGAGSLILVALYPWMKRITYWPQFFLGLTFNWGIFMGWATVNSRWQPAPFLLYAAGICWTLGYDTIYALQDCEDDRRVGVKSLALRFFDHIKFFLAMVYSLMILCLIGIGQVQNYSWIYYSGLSLLVGHFAWQIQTLNPVSSSDCHRKFKSNILTGGIVLMILLSTRL